MLGPDSRGNVSFASNRRFFPKINKDQYHLFNPTGLFLYPLKISALENRLSRINSRLRLISSLRLDNRNEFQSVKLAWSILHCKLKARILLPLKGNNKGRKTSTRVPTYTQTHAQTHAHPTNYILKKIL